jgi:uncharacterized protein YodC (DUF2158 family)
MANELKVGDIVQLKSGGPRMTVNVVEGHQVYAVWFAGAKREGPTSVFTLSTWPKRTPKRRNERRNHTPTGRRMDGRRARTRTIPLPVRARIDLGHKRTHAPQQRTLYWSKVTQGMGRKIDGAGKSSGPGLGQSAAGSPTTSCEPDSSINSAARGDRHQMIDATRTSGAGYYLPCAPKSWRLAPWQP